MEESKKYIIPILIVIIILEAIGIVGILFFKKYIDYTPFGAVPVLRQCQSALAAAQPAKQALEMLESDVVSNVTLYGTVKNILNRTVVLSLTSKNVPVLIDPKNLTVFTMKDGKRVAAKFSDIKIGQKLSVSARLSFTGQLIGFLVYIL